MRELNVESLAVMHAEYRLPAHEMRRLVDAVQRGAVFDHDSLEAHNAESTSLVAIVRFEDGWLAIRDGLHRATAIMLARPSRELLPQEYVLEEMTYGMFRKPNFSVGFCTPFDPRTEVRIADWSHIRREVQRQISAGIDPMPWLAGRRKSYTRPRKPWHDALPLFFEHQTQYAGVLT